MKLKALVATLGLIATTSASANDVVLDFGNVASISGETYFASGFIQHDVGSFTDQLKFSVLTGTSVIWNGLGTISDQPKVDGSNIAGLTVDLYHAQPGSTAFSLYAPIGPGDYVTNRGPLEQGYYYFQVSGTALGPSPSSYAYTASAAVPEPESYAMMLAGLGLLGVIARRRLRG